MEALGNTCTAFQGKQRIANGTAYQVAAAVKEIIGDDANAPIIIFDDITSAVIEIDFRGNVDEVVARIPISAAGAASAVTAMDSAEPSASPRGRGRPKLGVVSREVTLLPRHWDWLNSQSGGASVALRKLVEQARRANSRQDQLRQAQNAAYRFMSTMASDQQEFEEATRAFFAADRSQFNQLIAGWPMDVKKHILRLSERVFGNPENGTDPE